MKNETKNGIRNETKNEARKETMTQTKQTNRLLRLLFILVLSMTVVPVLTASVAHAAPSAEVISSDTELLALLNGDEIRDTGYTITGDIVIDAAQLLGEVPTAQLIDCSIVGDKSPGGGSVTITITDKTSVGARGLFNSFDNSSISNVNFVFEGNVRGSALVGVLSNGCAINDVNIQIDGNVVFADFSELDQADPEFGYYASPAFGWIVGGTYKDMSIVVKGQVGSLDISQQALLASAFANIASTYDSDLTLTNVNTSVWGGIFSHSDQLAASSGFINQIYLQKDGLISDNTVTVGTASTPASITAKNSGTPDFAQDCLVSGFIGVIDSHIDGVTCLLNNNTVTVYGSILQDNDGATGNHSVSSTAGLLASAVTRGSSMTLGVSGNTIVVDGAIECRGPGCNFASGALTYLSNDVSGTIAGNTVSVGSIKAISRDRGEVFVALENDFVYAMGFAMAESSTLVFSDNKVSVAGDITATNEGLSITTTRSPDAFSCGFAYQVSQGDHNSVTVAGNLIANSLFGANTAGYAYRLTGADNSSSVGIAGDVKAIAGDGQAVATGYIDFVFGSTNNIRVDVQGDVCAQSNGDSIAAGFATAVKATDGSAKTHEKDSVFVNGDVTSYSVNANAWSGGFISGVEVTDSNISITDCIVRGDGSVSAKSDTTLSGYQVVAGGFAGSLAGASVNRSACFFASGVTASGIQATQGGFAAQTDALTSLVGCTLLAYPDALVYNGHYRNFIGSYGGSNDTVYIVLVNAEDRTAYKLSYNADNEIWEIAAADAIPVGTATISNTLQLDPGFNYLLGYDNDSSDPLDWLDTPDYLEARFVYNPLTDYPVQITTTMTTTLHAALISTSGIVFDIIGVQGKTPAIYNVHFDSQGGSLIEPIAGVVKGSTVAKPDPDPVRAGYDFEGWYKDADCENEWDFTTDAVTEETTLYAGWTEIPVVYNVLFDSQGGSLVDTIEDVLEGSTIKKPDPDPVREGFDFAGWYKEADCENEWDFLVDAVTEETTLYAGWTEIEVLEGSFTVFFMDYDERPLAYRTVQGGEDAPPPPAPLRSGYEFTGWEGNYTNVWADSTVVATYREVEKAPEGSDNNEGNEGGSGVGDANRPQNQGNGSSNTGTQTGDSEDSSGFDEGAGTASLLPQDNRPYSATSVQSWSSLSLIFGLLGIVLAGINAFVYFASRRRKMAEGWMTEDTQVGFDTDGYRSFIPSLFNGVTRKDREAGAKQGTIMVLSILLSILPLILFFILDDLSLKVELVNANTLWVALALIVAIVLMGISLALSMRDKDQK